MTPSYEMVKLWFTPKRRERFWRKFRRNQETGCLEWIGSRYETGYGKYDFDGATVRAHRLVWILARQEDIPEEYGPDPHGDMCGGPAAIRHFFCDNPCCGEIRHLIGGTYRESQGDFWNIRRSYEAASEAQQAARAAQWRGVIETAMRPLLERSERPQTQFPYPLVLDAPE